MLSKEELMKPRYKVIADYPKSPFTVGDIKDYVGIGMALYPHLFKKLEWWEDRKPEDMPQYVKVWFEDEVTIIHHVDGDKIFWNYYKEQLLGIHHKSDGGTLIDYLLPATESEFLEYKN